MGGRCSTQGGRRRRVSRNRGTHTAFGDTHSCNRAAGKTARCPSSVGPPPRRSHYRGLARAAVCAVMVTVLRGQDQLRRRDQPLRRLRSHLRCEIGPHIVTIAGARARRPEPNLQRCSDRGSRKGVPGGHLDDAGRRRPSVDGGPLDAHLCRRRGCHPCRSKLHRRCGCRGTSRCGDSTTATIR